MRGFVFMLEAVFACLILVGVMLSLAHSHGPGPTGGPDVSGVLMELDGSGVLRPLAYSGDTQALESEIYIPGYQHTVVLCDASGSCTGSPPEATDVWASWHVLAGLDSYEPMEVRLYAWEG